MARVCTICQHKRRADIDRAIAYGKSIASISKEYSVSEAALYNHRDNHLTRQLLKANEIKQALDATSLAQELQELVDRTKRILDGAEADGQRAISLAAIRELRASYEFMVKLSMTLHQVRQEEEQKEATTQAETIDQAIRRLDPLGLRLFRVLMRHFQGHSIESGLQSLFREINCYNISHNAPKPRERSPEIQPDPVHQEPSNEEPQKAPPRTRTNPPVRHLEGGGRLYSGPSEEDPDSLENRRERNASKEIHAKLIGGFELGKLSG